MENRTPPLEPPPLCMGPLAIFAGTSEGRILCERLAAKGFTATVFVATAYGETTLPKLPGIQVQTGRLNEEEMRASIQGAATVVDATHPFAAKVSCNIRRAAKAVNAQYLRLLRPQGPAGEEVVPLPSVEAAAEFLKTTSGAVLVTTGSKELSHYTSISGFANRLHPRILPSAEGLSACIALGFSQKNILCMQGPFSHEVNLALLRSIRARWLVTKDTGQAGGLPEKLSAAKEAGAKVLLVTRPSHEEGLSLAEVELLLSGSAPPLVSPASPAPASTSAVSPASATPSPPGHRFPLFISLYGQPCLVVGGGTIAARRIKALQNFGALVTVVAPEYPTPAPGACHLPRPFQPGDTAGMRLVVAATNCREVNRSVSQECHLAGIPISVADSPEECSFFFPALCQSAHLSAGVVSTGKQHQLTTRAARAVRTLLEEIDP